MTMPQYLTDKMLAIAKYGLTDRQFHALMSVQEFKDADDWRAPPFSGVGFWSYCPVRFLAYLAHFKIEGKAPAECATWPVMPGDKEFTYFALGKMSGLIKIGRSRQPEYRISTLQHDRNGEPAMALAIIRGGLLEYPYHKVFKQWREDGEWFAPHPDILAEVERLTAISYTRPRADIDNVIREGE